MLFCTNCGKPLAEGGRFCASCGTKVDIEVIPVEPVVEEPVVEVEPTPAPAPAPEVVAAVEPAVKLQPKPEPPTNYLPRAIVMSILLFPTGIAAIVHAAKSHTAYIQGQYDLATSESELAAKWCRKTVMFGVIFWAAFILFYFILIAAAAAFA